MNTQVEDDAAKLDAALRYIMQKLPGAPDVGAEILMMALVHTAAIGARQLHGSKDEFLALAEAAFDNAAAPIGRPS